jgi:hypothetical protein
VVVQVGGGSGTKQKKKKSNRPEKNTPTKKGRLR